jgi:lysine 2-monooxygenase
MLQMIEPSHEPVVSRPQGDSDDLDLAVVGAGAAGTYVAYRVKSLRPDWSVALFERTDRIGGRLRSLRVPGLDHPIELGGMRFLTSHRRVAEVVTRFGLSTHAFDTTGGVEESFLRGRLGTGASDPQAGDGYDLIDGERGRSALDIGITAMESIVPRARTLTTDDWVSVRANQEYRGRPLTDWTIAEALGTILSPEGYRFVADAFGYDSGLRAFNAADAIEYVLGGGDPSAVARTPDDGMDAIPRAMAAAFTEAGGGVRLNHELVAYEPMDGRQHLRFGKGAEVTARRVVLATAVPALNLLANASPALDTTGFRRTLESVEAFPALKVYFWYDRAWWRDRSQAIRLTTDRPSRKVFYFGADADCPGAVLAAYTDGRHTEPWQRFLDGPRIAGSPVPDVMLEEVDRQLRLIHPGSQPPRPTGSAFSAWGADPHETGWSFWRAGVRSDDEMRRAVQPLPGVELFLCGEAFSRAQAWVEGALETAEGAVVAAMSSG